jgi:hypothetical protein
MYCPNDEWWRKIVCFDDEPSVHDKKVENKRRYKNTFYNRRNIETTCLETHLLHMYVKIEQCIDCIELWTMCWMYYTEYTVSQSYINWSHSMHTYMFLPTKINVLVLLKKWIWICKSDLVSQLCQMDILIKSIGNLNDGKQNVKWVHFLFFLNGPSVTRPGLPAFLVQCT